MLQGSGVHVRSGHSRVFTHRGRRRGIPGPTSPGPGLPRPHHGGRQRHQRRAAPWRDGDRPSPALIQPQRTISGEDGDLPLPRPALRRLHLTSS